MIKAKKTLTDKECAEKYCGQLREITGIDFRLATSELFVILTDGNGPKGHWKTWQDAKQSLCSSVQILARALLETVPTDYNVYGSRGQSIRITISS